MWPPSFVGGQSLRRALQVKAGVEQTLWSGDTATERGDEVAVRAPFWRGESIVLGSNLAFLAAALSFQRIRMLSIGVEPTDVAHAVAKSNLTFLILLAVSVVVSTAALWREGSVVYALLVAVLSAFVSCVLFILIAGQLWGS